MPIYAYQCKDCDAIFEVRATIQEKENGLALTCPQCSGHEARQLLTAGLLLHSDGEHHVVSECCMLQYSLRLGHRQQRQPLQLRGV